MPKFTPVDYDPFAATPAANQGKVKLTPVDHDPFAGNANTGRPSKKKVGIAVPPSPNIKWDDEPATKANIKWDDEPDDGWVDVPAAKKQRASVAEISDWQEVPINDWREVKPKPSLDDIYKETMAKARPSLDDLYAETVSTHPGLPRRDPFSYSPQEVEKMRAEFVASQGGNVFGGMGLKPGKRVDTRKISYTGDQGAAENIRNTTVGIGAGMYKAGKGIQQLAGRAGAAVGIPGAAAMEQSAKADRVSAEADFAPLREQSTAAKVGEFIGETAPFIAMPGGVAGGAMKRAATAGMGGAVMGAVMDPDNPGTGAAKGAMLGAGASTVMSGIGKVANAAMGNLPANATRSLSEKYKIPLTLSEEAQGVGSKMDTLMEQVPGPFGIKSFRVAQQQAAKDAATAHFGQYVIDPILDSTAAMKVANDAHLDGLYQTVRQNARSIPHAAASEVKSAATELLDRYPAVFETIQDSKVKKILADIAGDTSTQTVSTGLLNAQGQRITRQVEPSFSFDDLWSLRKGIGQAIGGAKTPTERAQLDRIYSAVSDDMEAMMSGDVGSKAMRDFRAANDAFKQYSVKFDAMREAYDKALGTTGAGEAFSPKKYATVLKNLANDPRYKKNVKWSDAEIEEMTGLANILQVSKRAGQFAENPPTGNRWGAPNIAAKFIGGGAGAAAGVAAGAAATAQAVGTGATASLLVKFLTTTRAGKNLVQAASKLNPEGPGMRRLMDKLYNQLPKAAVVAGTGTEAGNEGEGQEQNTE